MYLSSSLRIMGGSAFAGCRHLQKVKIGADCGAFVIAVRVVRGALTVETICETREESERSVQIEREDADALKKQLE